MKWPYLYSSSLLGWALLVTPAVQAANRIALVIGNSDYNIKNGYLPNAAGDAEAIAKALRKHQFDKDEVILKTDIKDKEAFEAAVDDFVKKLPGKELAVFYYSGHGNQIDGKNYLIPTQAKIDEAYKMPHKALELDYLTDGIKQKHPQLSIVILDACRDNPFPKAFRGGAEKGLIRDSSQDGMIIHYAAEQNHTANDGAGEHSPYAQALLENLNSNGHLSMSEFFNQVGVRVKKLTLDAEGKPKQVPQISGSPLEQPICFDTCTGVLTKEEIIWQLCLEKREAKYCEIYLEQYPEGEHAEAARAKLAEPKTSPGSTLSLAALTGYLQDKWQGWQRESESTRTEGKMEDRQGLLFKQAGPGIEMVEIQAGCFQMGSPASEAGRFENEQQHRVCLTTAYAIGKTEVTQGQWRQLMGSNPSYFTNCGDNCPVEQVSWDDVQTFIQKLNAQTEGGYRLPTEAEWEYACRSGGQAQSYCGGNNPDALAWYGSNSGYKFHPVGSKAPNALGLYDMSGNVWEWVQDYYGDYPSASVTDPHGSTGGADRVIRGGSWNGSARGVRAANRLSISPVLRVNFLGFRLARTR